jgi:tetratricopeptide (TPR) repeat protein
MTRRSKKKRREASWRARRWLLIVAVILAGLVVLFAAVSLNRPRSDRNVERAPLAVTYDSGMQLLADLRVDEAEKAFSAVLKAHPDSRRVRDELRWLYFNQFRQHELEALLEQGLRIEPYDFSLVVALMMSEFRPQNPREVLGSWERANRKHSDQPRVLAALGRCYSRVGAIDKARRAFQSALDLAPDDALIRLRVMEFLIELGEWASAEELLASASEQASDVYQDQMSWIRSLLAEQRGELDEALQHIERALRRRPQELAYVQRRGALLQLLGRGEEAADCFATANQLESYVGQLTAIVLSGELEQPTPALCDKIADLCQKRGKRLQAETWKRAATQLESSK